ncbi:MAG TPA: class I SAM-dependent methyltransferase, partial [Nitrospirae bacterium]|nr:class I SAM-dependent methyltransferase [Nitrospirota bacterium]
MNIFVNNIWDIKSKRYPLPFDDVTYKKTIEIIDIAIKNGVKISDSHILDIGCGTGIFTLPLARMASKIIGLDNSKAMLERLKDEAQKWSISNVSTFLKAWNDVDIETLCWKKSFHVVWASMTPAIKNDKDILKMEQCAKDWCVFIGWAKKRENDFYSEGFKLF